jgi:RimJ/RimL family protein N-acetyltransferase
MILRTERLVVRDWVEDDAQDALQVYGSDQVTRWLAPAMSRVPDADAMRSVLRSWSDESSSSIPPVGRRAVTRASDGALIGGLSINLLPPYDSDLEVGCQLVPRVWGNGYATEAMHALMHWAFNDGGADELFAVVRPRNLHAVKVLKRLGMQWVGVTDKYYSMSLHVYRMRAGELDVPTLTSLTADDTKLAVLGLPTEIRTVAGHGGQDGRGQS